MSKLKVQRSTVASQMLQLAILNEAAHAEGQTCNPSSTFYPCCKTETYTAITDVVLRRATGQDNRF